MSAADQEDQKSGMSVILQVGGLFLAILTTIGIPLLLLAQKVDQQATKISSHETRIILLERATGLPTPNVSDARKNQYQSED